MTTSIVAWLDGARNCETVIDTVYQSGLFEITSGQMKLPHENMKVITLSVTAAFIESGSAISQYVWKCDAPSISAASSSSRGTLSMNCLNTNSANGEAIHGTARPCSVFTHPSAATILYSGISVTAPGTMSAESAIRKSAFLPGNLKSANSYAAI